MSEVQGTGENIQNYGLNTQSIRGSASSTHEMDKGSYGISRSAIDSYNYVTHEGPKIDSPLLIATNHSISLAPTEAQALFLALTTTLIKLLHSLEKKNIEGESHSLQFTMRLGNMKKELQIELGNIRAAKHITAAVGSFASAGISAGSMGMTMKMKSNFDKPSPSNKNATAQLGGKDNPVDGNPANKPIDSAVIERQGGNKGTLNSDTTDGSGIKVKQVEDPDNAVYDASQDNHLADDNGQPLNNSREEGESHSGGGQQHEQQQQQQQQQEKEKGVIEGTEDILDPSKQPTTSQNDPAANKKGEAKSSSNSEDQIDIKKQGTEKTPDNAGTADQDKNLAVEKQLQNIRDVQMGADMLKELTRVATESTQAYLETAEGQLNAQMEVINTWQSINGVFGDNFKKAIDDNHRSIKEALDTLSAYMSAETQAIRTASSAG